MWLPLVAAVFFSYIFLNACSGQLNAAKIQRKMQGGHKLSTSWGNTLSTYFSCIMN